MKKMLNWVLVIAAILVTAFAIYASFNNLYNPDPTPIVSESFVSWMDSFENPELVIGEHYIVKDVRDVETVFHTSMGVDYLGYHTYLILENNEKERVVYKINSFNEDDVTMFNEYDDSIEGRTYILTPFVPGDIVTYLGCNEFEFYTK